MISEKQLEANRRNAQQSTGPKTAEGKAHSSRNNLRHGLTGHVNILPTENRQIKRRVDEESVLGEIWLGAQLVHALNHAGAVVGQGFIKSFVPHRRVDAAADAVGELRLIIENVDSTFDRL